MAIYLLRHGESEGNRGRYWQGHLDKPLTDLGEHQALAAGKWLKGQGVRLDAAYASPLVRAKRTAELTLAELGDMVPNEMPELMEYDGGRLEGMVVDEIDRTFPGYTDRPLSERGDFSAYGGEGYDDVHARLGRFVDHLRDNHEGEDEVLVTSHGGVLYQLIKLMCAWPEPRHFFIKISNCCLFKLEPQMVTGQRVHRLLWMMPLELYAPGITPAETL